MATRTVPLAAPPGEAEIRAAVSSTARAGFYRSLGAGKTIAQASASALVQVGGAVTREVLNAGRDTIVAESRRDKRFQGWIRVSGGMPCPFCAMLLSRGPVYRSEDTASFEAHDHCQCSAEPFVEGSEWPDLNKDLHNLWNEENGTATFEEWKQILAGNKVEREIPLRLPGQKVKGKAVTEAELRFDIGRMRAQIEEMQKRIAVGTPRVGDIDGLISLQGELAAAEARLAQFAKPYLRELRAVQAAADLETTAGLQEVGAVVRKEIDDRLAAVLDPKADAARLRHAAAKEKYDDAMKSRLARSDEIDKINNGIGKEIVDEADAKFGKLRPVITDEDLALYRERNTWIGRQVDARYIDRVRDPEWVRLDEALKATTGELTEARSVWRGLEKAYEAQVRDAKLEVLSEIREMGPSAFEYANIRGGVTAEIKAAFEEGLRFYPRSWWETIGQKLELEVRRGSRANYSLGRVHLGDSDLGTVIHEFGHHMERDPRIYDALERMYGERTAGEKLRWLGRGYKRDEKFRPDEFPVDYMGKAYPYRHTEVLSMLAQMYFNPTTYHAFRVGKDDWLQDFLLGMMSSL